MITSPHTVIRSTFSELRRSSKVRHRDIAQKLQISEGELVAAHVLPPAVASLEGHEHLLKAQRLRSDWPKILAALEPVGEVMALTRNDACVHEKVGVYANASYMGEHAHMGMLLGADIDLRLFYKHWLHGFAVIEASEAGPQRSLQFFDGGGDAVHKVFLRPASNVTAWEGLVWAFLDADQSTGIAVNAAEPKAAELPDTEIKVTALREAWASMRDTHEFFKVLKDHQVSRLQALRLADPMYATQVDTEALSLTLNAASTQRVPVMVFVGNKGVIQIHTGVVNRVASAGPWLNVLDEHFNLHLREDHIASAWVVGKPTSDGLVTSLELFDAQGETIAMLFGERKPGRPELDSWRALIAGVVREVTPCNA